jgi:molybdenum cofactor biosynthesis enzyme MoaA
LQTGFGVCAEQCAAAGVQQISESLELLEEQLYRKLTEAVRSDLRKAVDDATVEISADVRLKCENLLASTVESASLNSIQNARNAATQLVEQSTVEALDDLHSRWELQRTAHEDAILSTVEKKLDISFVELEGKVEKKIEKKLASAFERRFKSFELDLDIGK